jgi:DNA-binding protein HU-beta
MGMRGRGLQDFIASAQGPELKRSEFTPLDGRNFKKTGHFPEFSLAGRLAGSVEPRWPPSIRTKLPTTTSMAKPLTKSQLAASLADRLGISKKQGSEALAVLTELAYKHAKDTFTLPGIGKLVLVNRKARMGRNPKTGETIKIPAKKVVKFRVAKAAKDAILGSR